MRRLHSRMVGWGSIVGTRPRRPSEVLLKGLPPPAEVDPVRYRRFEREEAERRRNRSHHATTRDVAAAAEVVDDLGSPPLEPFYDIVDVAAGAKHFGFVTRDGNVILVGCNRYGQIGQPTSSTVKDTNAEAIPYFYDFRVETQTRSSGSSSSSSVGGGGDGDCSTANAVATMHKNEAAVPSQPYRFASVNAVACGCNFSLFYVKGGCSAFAVGNNHHGQLGLGHKQVLDNSLGFAAWDPEAPWLQEERLWLQQQQQQSNPRTPSSPPPLREPAVRQIVCGHTHTVIHMGHSGHIYTCGSNLWGELGLGNTTAPMSPTRMPFFDNHGLRVAQIAAGGGFTVYLTTCGRVFSCGATQYGQTPPNCFEPAAVPLVRVEAGKAYSSKLMRIKHIAATADAVVYVTVRNEILLQGAFPELGVAVPFPRYQVIQGRQPEGEDAKDPHTTSTSSSNNQNNKNNGVSRAKARRHNIVALHSGGNCVLVEYEDGVLYAFGCNSDGQITLLPIAAAAATGATGTQQQQIFNERLSPAHCIHQAVPIALPPSLRLRAVLRKDRAQDTPSAGEKPNNEQTSAVPSCSSLTSSAPTLRDRGVRIAVSSSGVLVLDHAELLGDNDVLMAEDPIELPPGSGTAADELIQRAPGNQNSREEGLVSKESSSSPPPSHRFRKVKF